MITRGSHTSKDIHAGKDIDSSVRLGRGVLVAGLVKKGVKGVKGVKSVKGVNWRSGWVLLAGLGLAATGCEQPRQSAKYPEDTLQVRYEASTAYSGCLIACVAMAANYLLDKQEFSETGIRQVMRQARLDETRIADVRNFLSGKGLHLVTLSGGLDGKPPGSLGYWVRERGYPAICVINRQVGEPGFNHAVVVIGISGTGPVDSADTIHYLDPSSPKQLHSEEAGVFEANWSRGQNAMLIVVQPPPR